MGIFSGITKNITSFFKKSLRNPNFDLLSYNMLSGSWSIVRANMAWDYYRQVQPINRGVNLISQEFSSIPAVLINKRSREVITEQTPGITASEVLKLFKNPNSDKTGKEFNKAQCSSYIVTGESYIKTTGLTGLQEIYWCNSADITVTQSNRGIPSAIRYNRYGYTEEYKLDEDGRYRTADGTKEIYQIVDFNPRYEMEQVGFSRLSSVYYEIEQYRKGNIHNISSLEKGARPSGIGMLDAEATPEQVDAVREQIKAFYSGSANSGNVIVTNSMKSFKELSLTNKDMEYTALNKIARNSLYETLEIPASFYDNKSSTYNNKTTDRINLYIFAVLPIADRLYEEYTKALMPRYKDGDMWEIGYVKRSIPALEPMFAEANLKKAQSGVFLINELREEYGLDGIGSEGDTLYQPLNLVPVGSSVNPQEGKAIIKKLEQMNGKTFSKEELEKIFNVIHQS